MTRPFLPPPEAKRCCAAQWCGYYNARCPNPWAPGSDMCETHRDMLAKGQAVKRVRRPVRVEAGR